MYKLAQYNKAGALTYIKFSHFSIKHNAGLIDKSMNETDFISISLLYFTIIFMFSYFINKTSTS